MMNESLSPSLTFTETKRLGSLRFLTRLLAFSGCCNFVALLIGLYGCFLGNFWLSPHHVHRLSPIVEHGSLSCLKDALDHFHMLSLHQLVEYLTDARCVKESYPIRALALSDLIWRHHFDVARALGSPLAQPQMLSLSINGQLCSVPLYLGLTSEDYDTLVAFGRKEQWPITAEAMFVLLKDPKTANNSSLREVFYLCEPFQGLHQSLLGDKPQEGHETRPQEGWSLAFCLDCILERDWSHLMQCAQAVNKHAHAASTHLARQTFLAFYPPEKELTAPMAAALLPIQPIQQPIQLVQQPVQSVQQPTIRPSHAKVSQSVAKVEKTEKVGPKNAIVTGNGKVVRGTATETAAKRTVTGTEASVPIKRSIRTPTATYSIPKLYVVRSGDSLWKIAQTFQVDVEKIKTHNALQSDQLRPGISLLIP